MENKSRTNDRNKDTFSEEYSSELGDFNANKVLELLAESKSENKKKENRKNV